MKTNTTFLWLILSLILLTLTACKPNDAKTTVVCDKQIRVCTATITNNEWHKVKYALKIGYEPQGTKIVPVYTYRYEKKGRFDHWEREIRYFFATDDYLKAGETQTFTATMPKEFFATPGQSLVDAYLQIDPPNVFSTAYGRYHAYATVSIPGYYDRPIRYTISCTGEKAKVTIANTGEWGDRNIALYLNGDLDKIWQTLTVKSEDTQTFTTDPIPDGTYLIEADVRGHQEQADYLDNFDYHGARGYCVPTQ